MYSIHLPQAWTHHADRDDEDREMTAMLILGRVCVGLAIITVAAGWSDWSVSDWTRMLTEILAFITGLAALGYRVLKAIRENGRKTDNLAAGTARAAQSAVVKAVDESALPTTAEQKAAFANEMADLVADAMLRKINAQQAAAAEKPPALKVQT